MDTLPIKQVHKSSSIRCPLNNLRQVVWALCLLGNLPGQPGKLGKHPLQLQCGRKGRADFHGNVLTRSSWRSFLSGQPGS